MYIREGQGCCALFYVLFYVLSFYSLYNPYCRLLESSPHGLFRGSPIHVILWVANCPRLVELIEIMVQLSALLLFIFLLVIESFDTPYSFRLLPSREPKL